MTTTGRRLMSRDQRREQLLAAAATAFARDGFAVTALDDVATAAGVTKAIIYRHFDSKADLYRELLDTSRQRFSDGVGARDAFGPHSVEAFIAAAAADPDGFRLLFRHAQREPEFREYAAELARTSADIAEEYLREGLPDARRRRWLAGLLPTLLIEIILSWLDADQPVDQQTLARTAQAASRGVVGSVIQP